MIKQFNTNNTYSDYVVHVAKFLILTNEIRKHVNFDSICFDYCHKIFFGNESFQNPLTKVRASSRLIESEAILLQSLIDDKSIQSSFQEWLDQIDPTTPEIQIIAEGAKKIPKKIDWEETAFGGGERYVHLYFKDRVEDFSSIERKLVRMLYTAFILIEYNRRS